MIRRKSLNISTQKGGTCFAHTVTRVVLNAIRQAIPQYFYPLDEDACDDVYENDVFDNLEKFIAENKCGEHSTNNLLMFAYIYKVITNKYGCDGGKSSDVFTWLIEHFLKAQFAVYESIISAFDHTISQETATKIFEISYAFIHEFYTVQHNDFNNYRLIVEKSSAHVDLPFIQYVLDSGYYIGLSKGNHIVTVVGYKINPTNGNILLIVKDSNSKQEGVFSSSPAENIYPIMKKDGYAVATLNVFIEHKYKDFKFILPVNLGESELTKQQETLAHREAMMSERHRANMESLLAKTKKGGRTKTRRTKSRVRRYKRKTKRGYR